MIDNSVLNSLLPNWKIFINQLGTRESSNNYAENEISYAYGRFQFTMDEINYLNNKYNLGFIDSVSFLLNSNLQDEYEKAEIFEDYNFIMDNNLNKYIGQILNGVQINIFGLLAGAHLGGRQGLLNYLTTKFNPSDELGTSISDYIYLFSKSMEPYLKKK